jgi:hypothetical protein
MPPPAAGGGMDPGFAGMTMELWLRPSLPSPHPQGEVKARKPSLSLLTVIIPTRAVIPAKAGIHVSWVVLCSERSVARMDGSLLSQG